MGGGGFQADLFYMSDYTGLCIAHVKNDVKWHPMVTKFGALIENMSRTGMYDCHIIFRFLLMILWEIVTSV